MGAKAGQTACINAKGIDVRYGMYSKTDLQRCKLK